MLIIRTFDGDVARVKDPVLNVQDVAVVGDNDGNNGNASLDSEVEGALLKRQQDGILGIASSAFGEHVDALFLGLDLLGGALHGGAGILGVCAVNEDGAAERHEPAEEGDMLELSLCRDGAVLGEHGAEHQDIELGLVVSNEDGGAGGAEDVVGVLDDKVDAGSEAHDDVECASRGPLGNLALAADGEDNGGEDAIEGDEEEREVGGERAANKSRLGEDGGQHEEGRGDDDVSDEEPGEVVEEEVHFMVLGWWWWWWVGGKKMSSRNKQPSGQ